MIIELLIEERKAKRIIEDATNKSNEIIKKAKEKGEQLRRNAISDRKIDQIIKTEEAKARKEAEKIYTEYDKKAEALRNKAEHRIDKALHYILKEVLTIDRD